MFAQMKFSHCYIVRNDKIVFMQIILKIIFKRKKTGKIHSKSAICRMICLTKMQVKNYHRNLKRNRFKSLIK